MLRHWLSELRRLSLWHMHLLWHRHCWLLLVLELLIRILGWHGYARLLLMLKLLIRHTHPWLLELLLHIRVWLLKLLLILLEVRRKRPLAAVLRKSLVLVHCRVDRMLLGWLRMCW